MGPILAELREIEDKIGVITTLQEKVVSLENKVESAFQVIHQQQLYLESIDNRERRSNLVIMGLSESSNDIGSTDNEKLRNVLSTANCPADIDPSRLAIRRLGQPNSTRPRPLHVTLNNQQQRDAVIGVAKNLKNAGATYSQVYIKKDIHPVVRKEIGRLIKREKEEREKAENVTANIEYDRKNRVLLRNGIVIDRFTPKFF